MILEGNGVTDEVDDVMLVMSFVIEYYLSILELNDSCDFNDICRC